MRNQKPIVELQDQVDYLIKRDQEELATLRAELNALKQTQALQSKLRRRIGFVAMLSLVLGSGIAMAIDTFSSNAAIPATIPYEGYLEIGGVAVDGNRNMQFELLHCTSSDAATCQPDAVWDSGVVPVSVSAGRFATLLGDEAHDADTYTVANHGLFVRISVDATGDGGALTQLGQLQQIHSVPFAANAGLASKAKDFEASGIIRAASVETTGTIKAEAGFGYVPVGTILPWHKDIVGGGGLVLPDGWVECSGGIVNDDDSPIDGQQIPDLNNAWNSNQITSPDGVYRGRYLRGGSISGRFNTSSRYEGNGVKYQSQYGAYYGATYGIWRGTENGDKVSYTETDNTLGYPYIQVAAMTVVYIMRIK